MLRYDIRTGVKKIKTKTALAVTGGVVGATGLFMGVAVPAVTHAADSTVTISGNTAAAENDPGWMFNRDASTSTPYTFTTAQHSIGKGSLYVQPIGSTPSDKFIGEDFIHMPVSDINSISYDFLISGNGTASSADQFYMNVYANYPTSNPNKFYDCRFDYVPTSGSTSVFTTATFASTDTPTVVNTRSGSAACPATLAGMPSGSVVRMFSISVGDTSASDQGLAGYLDNVQLATVNGTTIYDFEPSPASFQVKPWTYDPGKTRTVSAAWLTRQGLSDAGNSNHALYLTKDTLTSANAASGATVNYSGRLDTLGFDYRNDGHCGAGAPRLNVYTSDGVTHFFGCAYGTHSVNGDWTRVELLPTDGLPAVTPSETVTGMDVVFDEGTDQGQGFVYLDNIQVNGVYAGKPGLAQ